MLTTTLFQPYYYCYTTTTTPTPQSLPNHHVLHYSASFIFLMTTLMFSTLHFCGDPSTTGKSHSWSWREVNVLSHVPRPKTSSNYICCCSLPFQFQFQFQFHRRRRRRHILLLASPPHAKNTGNYSKKRRPWWYNFFSDNDDAIWSDWRAEDVLSDDADGTGGDQQGTPAEIDKFESWKRKVEAISELREEQEAAAAAANVEGRQWEDWLGGDLLSSNMPTSSWDGGDSSQREEEPQADISDDPYSLTSTNGLARSIRNFIMGYDDDNDDDNADADEFLFEDKVFRYASTSSAKFVALLILIPWVIDFLVHDYIFMPFLDRYVKLVPLAAEMLDVKRHQKLEMVKILKLERARFQFEVEIGKSPPLSDEEIWLELRHKAIELREDLRLENRRAFANIWSDMVYGISLFLLIYANKSKVALLKFTGYKLLNNISDTGKAFLIILITDIFLGYHSESGWQALVEIILEHYGLQVDPAAITIFVCSVPVVIDACVKLWLFKFLPRLSPNVANIFREMKRH